MIALPELREYQSDLRERVKVALARHRSAIACMAPGGGKTRLAKNIIGSVVNRGPKDDQSGNVVFAVHRRGLVDNASDSFAEDPSMPHGVIMSGRETAGGLPVQVASIDTLLSWYCEGGVYSSDYTFDFIVFDETHSHVSKLRTFLEAHNAKRKELGQCDPFVLGLTATPEAQELSKVYGKIVMGPTNAWMVESNFLKPFRYFQAKEGQLGKLVKNGDTFTSDSLDAAMGGLGGDLVRDWKKYAEGRATIGFFARRSHAEEAAELLVQSGVNAAYLDGRTPDEERKTMFRDMRNGLLDYICNVGVVERGTDIPRVGCVQLCTAIASLKRYLQIIGRGSRLHPEVANCLILDHGGNVRRHGFFDDPVEWTLEYSERPSKEQEARLSMVCPNPACRAIYRGGKCRACGYEPNAKELKAEGLEFDGTELKEVKKSSKPKSQRSDEQLIVSALYAAGKSGRTFKQAYGMASGMAKRQGTKFRIPAIFEVAGNKFRPIPYGHPDGNKQVKHTYGFTVGDYMPSANPYMVQG